MVRVIKRALTLWVMLWLASCSEPGSDSGVEADVHQPSDYVEDFKDVILVDTACPSQEPTVDHDGDGLPSGIEDANRNCQVDLGETDPSNPDTDGDTIADGDEDINSNGIVDNGELDPLDADSDDNGVLDGEEGRALVCTSALIDSLEYREGASGLVFASPPLARFQAVHEAGVDLFSVANPSLYGALLGIEFDGTGDTLDELLALSVGAIQLDSEPSWQLVSEESGYIWPHPQGLLPQTAALRLRWRLEAEDELAPALLRDQLVTSWSGLEASSETSGLSCESLQLGLLLFIDQAHSKGHVLAVLGCEDEQSDALIKDLLSGTMIAMPGLYPDQFLCEVQEANSTASSVDILWIVDNTRSMGSKQRDLASASTRLVDILEAAQLDWRIGLSTTETYLLDEDITELSDDLELDSCSGLRKPGFIGPDTPDLKAALEALIAESSNCEPSAYGLDEPSQSNLCGNERESGIASSLTVLDRSLSQGCSEAYSMRPEARKLVIWSSDEEDALFKDEGVFEAWSEASMQRQEQSEALIEELGEYAVKACAIVGDQGLLDGGTCTALEEEGVSSDGAQWGLGYIEVAFGLGGISPSICGEQEENLQACAGLALGLNTRYELSDMPILPTLAVAVDGDLLTEGAEVGWRYDANTNAVLLQGVELSERSKISVAYSRWAQP